MLEQFTWSLDIHANVDNKGVITVETQQGTHLWQYSCALNTLVSRKIY